ncbi:unnamed protein product [Caenorhabditis nigoni]
MHKELVANLKIRFANDLMRKRDINTKIQKTTVDSVKVYVEDHASRLKKNVNNVSAKKSEKIDCDVTYQTITLK